MTFQSAQPFAERKHWILRKLKRRERHAPSTMIGLPTASLRIIPFPNENRQIAGRAELPLGRPARPSRLAFPLGVAAATPYQRTDCF